MNLHSNSAIALLVSVSLLSILATIDTQPVYAVTWTPPVLVPMDFALTVGPSITEDQIGRVWLAWAEKPFGGSTLEDVYFKYRNSFTGTWVNKVRITGPDNAIDTQPLISTLSNGTTMVVWSTNRTGNRELFYRLYQGFSPVTGPIQLTSHPLDDRAPSVVQDRKGRIWVAWERANTTTTPIDAIDLYYKYFDGTAWSADFLLPVAMSSVYSERGPTIMQAKDGRVWIVWASDEGGQRTLELYGSNAGGMLDRLPLTGVPWATRVALTSDTKEDDNPVMVQDREGTLWVFWQRDSATDGDILQMNSLDNGATWGRVTPFASTTESESLPTAAMMSDRLIWVFWNRQNTTTGTKDILFSTSSPIIDIHDVGVSGLSGAPSFVRSGDAISITVSVSNYGDFSENTVLTVKLNTTIIYTLSLSLLDGEIGRVIQFTHQTSQGFWGRYVLQATVQTVTGENLSNQGDNSWTDGLFRVTPPGDVDLNGTVDILDAAALAFAYGTTPGVPGWNPDADIDHNDIIDILDAAQLAFYFGASI